MDDWTQPYLLRTGEGAVLAQSIRADRRCGFPLVTGALRTLLNQDRPHGVLDDAAAEALYRAWQRAAAAAAVAADALSGRAEFAGEPVDGWLPPDTFGLGLPLMAVCALDHHRWVLPNLEFTRWGPVPDAYWVVVRAVRRALADVAAARVAANRARLRQEEESSGAG